LFKFVKTILKKQGFFKHKKPMRFLKKISFKVILSLTILTSLMYLFDVDYLLKAIRTIYLKGHKTAYLEDYKAFDNRVLSKSKIAQPWGISKNYNNTQLTPALEKINQNLGTTAFLIIKNDSIWSENYYDNFNKDSKSNSFSMAKSIVCAALGKAIMQNKIKSLDQPVGDFFKEFKIGLASQLTVGNLASMSSGLNWDEAYYNPFSITTRAYFDDDLNKVILGLKVITTPGKAYKYLSGNTQLLAMVIEKATNKSLADFVSENFWQPLGAENEAFWQTDKKDGIVKAYCCFASNARDFARFGKLYKQNGKWNGQIILDSSFVAKSITPRFKSAPQYGYGWWLCEFKNKRIFYMHGHLGQYVIVIPEDDLIIVRLGNRNILPTKTSPHNDDFFTYIEETYKMLSHDRKN
jgi:CubicO group peptidase (beta-lactamase class C family)